MKQTKISLLVSYNKISSPLKNGEKIKKLKKQHTETLAQSGLRPPKSPL